MRAFLTALTVLAVFSWVPMAGSYPQYSGDPDGGCDDCHGGFRSAPYISLVDGMSWGQNLHDVHRSTMLSSDCSTCHNSGGRFPVFLDFSSGGNGLPPISCMGCHGRDQDANLGAGLRQHHFNAGETICASCHSDSDPANYTPVGEDFLPPFYMTPDANHPNKPTDSCSPNDEEQFRGTALGLDNDGDLAYDTADSDCRQAVCGDGNLDPGEECDDGNVANGDCCSSTCGYEAAGSSCSDGQFCNGFEMCDGAGVCQPGGDPCRAGDTCNEAANSCQAPPECVIDADCSDGAFCNGAEVCSNGTCQAGSVPCAAGDTCNEATNSCQAPPECVIDADCSDGAFCNGTEVCSNGTCQAGSAPCEFGETCNEATNSCQVQAECVIDADCNDGAFCNGAEVCSNGTCQAGSAPCAAGDVCDETVDTCGPTTNDDDDDHGDRGRGRRRDGEKGHRH